MSHGHLAGGVAIVTGDGTGIGRAIALSYGRKGARVVVADINADTATAVADAINVDGGHALAVPTDVANLAGGPPAAAGAGAL
jgi:NAD(P)-dependent dehydrogenase (short-subunit alcohol dehydrogenase family)